MKATLYAFYTNPKYAKVFEWCKLLIITGSAQVAIQLIGMMSGIMIVRLLPTKEYALYTLANTMLGTIALLADGGISTGVMAEGGKVWQDREKLGSVLVTGLALRKKFALGSIFLVSPVLFYLLLHNGAMPLRATLIILSLIPTFVTSLSGTLLQIIPKLHQDLNQLQRNQIYTNAGRLVCLTLSVIAFPFSYVAILASAIPQIWSNFNLRKISNRYVIWSSPIDVKVEKRIFSLINRVLPTAVYYSFSGQIAIWILSFTGSTTGIAQIGALSRISTLLNLFALVLNLVFVPRFSRLDNNKELLLRFYLYIIGGLTILLCFIVFLIFLFPTSVLWFLGNQYINLKSEIVLLMAGSGINLLYGTAFNLYSSRGWIIKPIIYIPLNLIIYASWAYFMEVSTLKGVLLMNVFVAFCQFIIHIGYGMYKIVRVPHILKL